MIRIIVSIVWVSILWGVLGGILQVVTVETPDWAVTMLAVVGGVAMWFSLYLDELRRYLTK